MKEKVKTAATVADELKELDLTGIKYVDVDGNAVDIPIRIEKDLANIIYRSVVEVDFITPSIDLSSTGKCRLTDAQLDRVEDIVRKSYTLVVQVPVCERIAKARTPIM